MGYIYGIYFPDGMVYIGMTRTSIEERRKSHKNSAKYGKGRVQPVHIALRKYNMVDTFELIVIDTAYTLEELCEKEQGYIRMYRSSEKEYGYNRTIGGAGATGYVHTEEDRKKQSESQKKRMENPELRKKHSQATKKYFEETPGAREKQSEAQKKRYETLGAREKQSEATKKYYEETPGAREKQSEAQKKRYETPGAREKQSETWKKYYEETPGAREKQSVAQKKRYETPGAREKQSEVLKKYFKNHPEAREKQSEARKKRFKKPGVKHQLLDAQGKNKPFDVFTEDGTFVKTFTYQMDAKEYLQKEYDIISTIKIGEVLKGRRKSTAGFVFKYK